MGVLVIIIFIMFVIGGLILSTTDVLDEISWFECEYCSSKNHTRIKFDSFRKFYEIAPDTWDLEDYCVYKNRIDDGFGFGLIDLIRYKKFKKSIEYKKDKKNNNKRDYNNLSKLTKLVQNDIDTLNDKTDTIIKEEKKKYNDIVERIVIKKC